MAHNERIDEEKRTHQLHADQEMILVLDQELEDLLREHMVSRPHRMDRMRQHARLEDKC